MNNLGFGPHVGDCFNLVMAMIGNHTCTEGYNVGVLISNAICYISYKVLLIS